MKKYVFFAMLSTCLMQVRAQSAFAPVGAEWWYQGSNPVYTFNYGITWTDHLQVIKDTIIDNTPCRQLKTTRMQRQSNNPNETYLAHEFYYYIYDNVDSVFIYDDSVHHFTPLYVFNVQEGDTVTLPVPFKPVLYNIISPLGDSFSYVIDSIRTEIYDTAQLKTFYTHSISDSNYLGWNWGTVGYTSGELTMKGRYAERLGGNWSEQDPYGCLLPRLAESDVVDISPYIFSEDPEGFLACYSDSLYGIKLSEANCNSIPYPFGNIGINPIENPASAIIIYPNPASYSFTISTNTSFPKDCKVLLTDMYGRVTQQLPDPVKGTQEAEYNINGILPGMYFVKIQSADAAVQKKIVITR